jgi:biofilm PGA synthesis N-glycosyltransferase PgaC
MVDQYFLLPVALQDFLFLYPVLMTYVWVIGALFYYVKWERHYPPLPPTLAAYPPISILVPCHNEGSNIRETIHWLLQQEYPNYEIIAINDGSKDDTGTFLDELVTEHARLRVVHLATNQGKAMALRMGALLSPNEYLVCIDADAILDVNACQWLMSRLLADPQVGAVTGNPRVRNRSTLLGRIQVGEFSCIVGTIKRTQDLCGRLFSISGAIAGFRKSAIYRIGYWSPDMVTEDVDITWKLQRDGWRVRFEPNAKCWILMPETLSGLWRQRLRWAQGGAEVLIRNINILWNWKHYRLWPIFGEFLLTLVWVYLFIATAAGEAVYFLLGKKAPLVQMWGFFQGEQAATVLLLSCLVQFGAGFYLDRRHEKRIWKTLLWIVWYPFVYWAIVALTTFVGLPKALFKKRGERAIWTSPDRGFKP